MRQKVCKMRLMSGRILRRKISMKKWAFITLSLLAFVWIPVIFSSCEHLKDAPYDVKPIEFSHKGHKYLKFLYSEHIADTGTVHDPDCPCLKGTTTHAPPNNGL